MPVKRPPLFVIGTDTNVGKTVFSCLLARHLTSQGIPLTVAKPFCSGGRDDARLLRAAAGNRQTLDDINPFHFEKPLTPLLAAREAGVRITLDDVLGPLRSLCETDGVQLVEGAGGLLSPLGEGFDAMDLIESLGAQVILVARNQLGVVNHVALTARELQRHSNCVLQCVVLMGGCDEDASVSSNHLIINEILRNVPVYRVSDLGEEPAGETALEINHIKVQKVLEAITGHPYFPPPFDGNSSKEQNR